MSDPQTPALPVPAPMVLVDHFSVVIVMGVVRFSSFARVPQVGVPGDAVLVTGPSLAMSIPDALALAGLIHDQVEQLKALQAQADQPN